ncbi:Molybdenum cofactor guanylyltransferase [subsurface metagenome]
MLVSCSPAGWNRNLESEIEFKGNNKGWWANLTVLDIKSPAGNRGFFYVYCVMLTTVNAIGYQNAIIKRDGWVSSRLSIHTKSSSSLGRSQASFVKLFNLVCSQDTLKNHNIINGTIERAAFQNNMCKGPRTGAAVTEDKSILLIKGQPMIKHIYDQLRPNFNQILISSKDISKYSFLGVEVIPDKVIGRGPLGGIASVLVVELRPNPPGKVVVAVNRAVLRSITIFGYNCDLSGKVLSGSEFH